MSQPESITDARKLSNSALHKFSKNELIKLILTTKPLPNDELHNTPSQIVDSNEANDSETRTTINISTHELCQAINDEVSKVIYDLKSDLAIRFDDVDSQLKQLKGELQKYKSTNESLTIENKTIMAELKSLRRAIETQTLHMSQPSTDKIKNQAPTDSEARRYTDAIKSVQSEEKNREIRKINIKIRGIPSCPTTSEKENVQRMVAEISPDTAINVVKAVRHVRPHKEDIVIASFSNQVHRNAILAKARSLKDSQHFSNTHLSPDWTREQELEQYELRMKKKRLNDQESERDPSFCDWYVIRNSKLVKLSQIRRQTNSN